METVMKRDLPVLAMTMNRVTDDAELFFKRERERICLEMEERLHRRSRRDRRHKKNEHQDSRPNAKREPTSKAEPRAAGPHDGSVLHAGHRNSPCPCGSGLKYKHCHEARGTTPAPIEINGLMTGNHD